MNQGIFRVGFMALSEQQKTQIMFAYRVYCLCSLLAFATTVIGMVVACPSSENPAAGLPTLNALTNTTPTPSSSDTDAQCRGWRLSAAITTANLLLPLLQLMYLHCGIQQCCHTLWSRVTHGSPATPDEEMRLVGH